MARIINTQIISIQQDSKGQLYNVIRSEDEYGYYSFENVPIEENTEKPDVESLVDFREFGGHQWFYNNRTNSIHARTCNSPDNCKVCKDYSYIGRDE